MSDSWSISLEIPSYPACMKCRETETEKVKEGVLVPVIKDGQLAWHCTKCGCLVFRDIEATEIKKSAPKKV